MEATQQRMTEGSIWKKITFFALPIFLGNLFQQMYNTADSLIVGNFLGSNALAAVSSSGSLIFLLIGFLSGIAIGAGVVISRYFGARDDENVQIAIHTTAAFGLVAGVLMTLVGVLLSPQILVWMGTPDAVMDESLTYLQIYEPGNLKRVAGNEYRTIDHDSLRISNGKWHWYSKGIGGHNALQYLMKVREMKFPDAVRQILQLPPEEYQSVFPKKPPEKKKEFSPPSRNYNHNQVIAYLEGRGISRNVIFHCIKNKTLYESQKYHSAVFLGMDKENCPRYGNIRATKGDFKGECSGSDKRYAFHLMPEQPKSNAVHVFEAAIDALSFATYAEMRGAPWKDMNLLALGGVAGTGQKVPLALEQFLKDHPQIKTLYLHLDNDTPGREATQHITNLLKNTYQIHDVPPTGGKDVNDFLMKLRSQSRNRTQERQSCPSL